MVQRRKTRGGRSPREQPVSLRQDTHHVIDQMMSYGFLLKERVIYYPTPAHTVQGSDDNEGYVDVESTRIFIKAMEIMAAFHKPGADLRIIMNCYGGDEYQGMAVFDAIQRSPLRVTIEGRGAVMSMAMYILQAASAGGRVLAPDTRIMIHTGTWGIPEHMHSMDAELTAQEYSRLRLMYTDVLFRRVLEKNREYLRENFEYRLSREWYMSAEEAINLGLADRVG